MAASQSLIRALTTSSQTTASALLTTLATGHIRASDPVPHLTTAPMSLTANPSITSTSETSTATCTHEVPGKYGHVSPSACNAYYWYYPSFGWPIAFAAFFGILAIVHTIQAFHYRKRFCWVLIMACLWEWASFVLRADGAHDQQNIGKLVGSMLFMLLAPLLINAFAYMTVGRLIYFFLPEKMVYKIKAAKFTKYFVGFDILSFIIQATGGNLLAQNENQNLVRIGQKIYMTGMGMQEFFILLFCFLIVRFYKRMLELERDGHINQTARWRRVTWTLFTVLMLITTRIIFRFCEFAKGTNMNNEILMHEAYIYVLDGFPMLLACLILAIFHPGLTLIGPESEFPRVSRKEKKRMKREKKEAKKVAKGKKAEKKRGHKERGKDHKIYSRASYELENGRLWRDRRDMEDDQTTTGQL